MLNLFEKLFFLTDIKMGWDIGCWLRDDIIIPAYKEAIEEIRQEKNKKGSV